MHDPVDHVLPLGVVVAHARRQRLLGDDLAQHAVVGGVVEVAHARGEVRLVGGEHIAALLQERFLDFRAGAAQRGVAVAQVREVVRQVLFSRRAGLHADRRAVHVGRRVDVRARVHREALAGVEGGLGEVDRQVGVARGGDRGRANQHIDLAGGEQREAGRSVRGVDVAHRDVVAHRGRNRLAELDVEADHAAVVLAEAEQRLGLLDAAEQFAALLHGGQSGAGHIAVLGLSGVVIAVVAGTGGQRERADNGEQRQQRGAAQSGGAAPILQSRHFGPPRGGCLWARLRARPPARAAPSLVVVYHSPSVSASARLAQGGEATYPLSGYRPPAGTSKPKMRAPLRPRILARSSSSRSPIERSIAAAECGQEPSWCG